MIRRLDALDREAVLGPLDDLRGVEEGVLRNRWFTLVSDREEPYLDGAGCDDLRFGWRDPRFAYVNALASLERTRRWLFERDLEHAVPIGLQVRISESEASNRYDVAKRELTIGSRQCADVRCACDPGYSPCPQSADGRPIFPHAQDGEIVVHEYGHALLHHLVCRGRLECALPTGQIVTALDEGFADYVASAVNRSSFGEATDPFCLGEWYNSLTLRPGQCLRRLDSDLHWPEAARALRETLPYGYSTIWTSVLLKARLKIPDGTMDRIVFDAHSVLYADMSFEQMASRLVEAAERIDNGQYAPILRRFLRQQGFLVEVTSTSGDGWRGGRAHPTTVTLDSWALSSFPTFDHSRTITITGAEALQLDFDRVRLRDGDCLGRPCGRIYLGDASGTVHEVITGAHDEYRSVIVPGDTVVLRFVASFDHTRTTIYRVTGIRTLSPASAGSGSHDPS